MEKNRLYDGNGNEVIASNSYILNGTLDNNNDVTLTNFDWNKLVAAIGDNVHVAARLNQLDNTGAVLRELEFSLAVHDLDDEQVDFINITSGFYSPGIDIQHISVMSDGTVFYYSTCIQV